MMLDRIQKENDVKKLNIDELKQLSEETREFLLKKTSEHGGHVASNLGVVELTIALHKVFQMPEDKIIWDVGHQSYTHKMLTGRKDGFEHLRQFKGMSGFPKRSESNCDAFDTGHSTTSISAGLGYVAARDARGEDYSVISVIGDGSLTGGMAYEAFNNAAQLKSNFIIILNDNHMSISENVGGMSQYLAKIRTADFYTGLKKGVTNTLEQIPVVGDKMISKIKKTKSSIKQLLVPGMWFEEMGLTYLGPIPGHNIEALCKGLQEAKRMEGAVVVHVLTKKGKGYEPAEKYPDKFHGIGPFNLETGESIGKSSGETYTSVFGKVMCDEVKKDPNVSVIVAAMADGTGLAECRKRYPKQFYDVGIAEQHAVTMAAGMAAGGLKPVFAVYSSFLQRGYDQIVHDVALQKLPVVFAIDRGGLVGNDGETHQGIFDVSYMRSIPNMTILSPKNKWELADMVRFAVHYNDGPIALRYPRGAVYTGYKEYRKEITLGKSEMIFDEKDIAILSFGHMFEEAEKTYRNIKAKGYPCSLVNARFAKPIDEEMIEYLSKNHRLLAVVEENITAGGFSEGVMECVMRKHLHVQVLSLSIPDMFVEHGSISELRKMLGIDSETMTERIINAYKEL